MYSKFNYKPRRWHGRNTNGLRRPKTFNPSAIVNGNNNSVAEAIYEPKYAFSDFEIAESLKANIASRGYLIPTAIQDQAIPSILSGQDVVGIANTGTGKTAAFLIPLINKVYVQKNQRVLIVTPTRELAVQIEDELFTFTKGLNIFSCVCIGGVSIRSQIYGLYRNPQFVIGTPGRLLDLNSQHKIDFSKYGSVVLDEVDRMLDMGFINDIRKIVSQLPHGRQSLFFSATMVDKVMSVMKQFTSDPVRISVKSRDATANIHQQVIKINGKPKINLLHELLEKDEFRKVLIFGRTKRGVEQIHRNLFRRGIDSYTIHGNKTQSQRQRSLDSFRYGKINILIATDVASRGIDVNDITHVINYDLPETYEDYIHRIGRTGRASKQGVALTFVD